MMTANSWVLHDYDLSCSSLFIDLWPWKGAYHGHLLLLTLQVSFKWLSCKLGVHVNLAKQMLYQFMTLEASKTRKDRLHPIYYLSGRAPTAWIDSLDGDSTSPPPPPPEKKIVDPCLSPDLFAEFNEPEGVVEESFLVMLVKGEELEEYQTHFSQLFSLHLYGLSAYPMTKPLLDEFTATPIFDDKGRAPVQWVTLNNLINYSLISLITH